uniref:DUF1634 domain-containing protein n=1 Tax=Chlorobium chlorochromatii (strain CaD3) TaxID=340177 RepID=Q3AP65_CHLCH
MSEQSHADKVQLAYAAVLGKTSTIGIGLIVVGYALYVMQILPATASPEVVASHWHLRASELHQAINVPNGWDWLGNMGYGDVLSFASLAYLATVTTICLITVIPVLLKENDKIYAVITTLQVLVLLFAAAGIVSGGH